MECEDFKENVAFEDNEDCSVFNNNSVRYKRKSLTRNLYELGIVGFIDLEDGSNSQMSPTPPTSPPIVECFFSTPEVFDSPDNEAYRRKKKRNRILTNSSSVTQTDDEEDMFSYLSDEIILQVFAQVPKPELATLSLVCKRFRELCLDETLWPRLDLSYRTMQRHTLTYVLTRGVRALRLNFSGINSPIFDPLYNFEKNYTFKIQFLDLTSANVSVKDLETLFKRCRSLKKLSLESCELSDAVCQAIARNTRLDTLNMAMCTELSNEGLLAITTSCTNLENVNISWCGLSAETVSNFCNLVSPSLLSLNIAGALKSLTNKDVDNLVSRCKNLAELDVSDCFKITGQSLISVARHLNDIQSLSICRCYKVEALSILKLKDKASLCTLNMFGNMSGSMFSVDYMKMFKAVLGGVAINSEMMSSVARPTVGIRRTSIWGIRCRN